VFTLCALYSRSVFCRTKKAKLFFLVGLFFAALYSRSLFCRTSTTEELGWGQRIHLRYRGVLQNPGVCKYNFAEPTKKNTMIRMCTCACAHKCVRPRACERGAVCECDVAHVDIGKRFPPSALPPLAACPAPPRLRLPR